MLYLLINVLAVLNNAFAVRGLYSPSLLEIIEDKADYDSSNNTLQEKFMKPYVLNMYEEMSKIGDSNKNGGTISILLQEEGDQHEDDRRMALTFNISGILSCDISLAHLVLNTLGRMEGRVSVRTTDNRQIEAEYTDFGYVADITTELNCSSKTLHIMLDFSGRQVGPHPPSAILAIYEGFSSSDIADFKFFIFKSRRRKKRSNDGDNLFRNEVNSGNRNIDTDNISKICRLHPWILDFSVLGWDNWLWIPRSYEANVCRGSCTSIFQDTRYNSTAYAELKNFYHMVTGLRNTTTVPRACCTPIEYGPLSVTYFSQSNMLKYKTLPNAKVKACGCR